MRVLRMVFHLNVRKNHVENVSGDVRIGTWHERKVHRQKHMGRQMTGGIGSESDIHHRETTIVVIRIKKDELFEVFLNGPDRKCKRPYEQLLLRQLDGRSCP